MSADQTTMTRSALAAVIIAVAVGVGGCAIPDQHGPVAIGATSTTQPATTQPGTSGPSSVVLFLVRGSRLVGVNRNTKPELGAAIADLLTGPTAQELTRGLTSAIPTGTKLDSAAVSQATAELDFTDALGSVSGQEELLAFAQIVATAVSRPGVQRVQISIAGQTVNAPLADGTLAQGPVSRADYASLLPS